MSNVYYTLQVDRLDLGDPEKWRLTVTQCVSDGSSVTEQRLYFERLFDSQEEAGQYGSTWASVQRTPVIHASAITQLRSRFHGHGFNVSDYSNDQVSNALLEEAAATTRSSVDLFVRAFQRLRRVEPPPPKMPSTAFKKTLRSDDAVAASVHASRERMKKCNAAARARKLMGADRKAFMKNCLRGK
jgi:psiF repeat